MSKPIRLMQITHDLAIGGLQQVVVSICRSIDRDKFDVSVLCLRSLGEFIPEIEDLGIKVHYLPQKESGTDYLSFLNVARILRQEKIDVIHTHNTQPFIDGTIGAWLSGVKTIVHTDHARDFPDKKRYMFAEWLMSHWAYGVVGVSEHTTANLRKYEKITKKKLLTIPNGVSQEKFELSIDKEKLRQELGIRNTGPVIGLGVRLSEQKGITYLIKAMKDVIKEVPDISLVIAGDGPLQATLDQEVLSLELSENIFFVGPRTDMPRLLKLFDLYVLPSLWEGLPMVLLEAMAAGCPIIATNVGGNMSAIKDGFNGFLVPSKNTEELARTIINLLNDVGLQDVFIRNSYEVFKRKFSAEKMTKEYEQLYAREI